MIFQVLFWLQYLYVLLTFHLFLFLFKILTISSINILNKHDDREYSFRNFFDSLASIGFNFSFLMYVKLSNQFINFSFKLPVYYVKCLINKSNYWIMTFVKSPFQNHPSKDSFFFFFSYLKIIHMYNYM